ncbi:hypothetical protein H4R24_004175 [Coemansia sp. RSA 988]|nr:hypothetical protein H4R24_004175 [Coemansia sp. RSA 988]
MEVEISPITPDITKQLARLYPSAEANFPEANDTTAVVEPRKQLRPSVKVLDGFFAADFIPPRDQSNGNHRMRQGDIQQRASTGNSVEGADRESYGVKYVRYLHQFVRDLPSTGNGRTESSEAGWVAEECAAGLLRALDGRKETEWGKAEREKMLARAVVVQARIEQSPGLLPTLGARLAEAFGKSQLATALWQSIRGHLHPGNSGSRTSTSSSSSASSSSRAKAVALDELEVAMELLYLFSNWSEARAGAQGVQQLVLAIELFTRYSRQAAGRQQGEVGRVQRMRLGHKALLLLEITWVAVVGDEAEALQRIGADNDSSSTAKGLQQRGLARDALRQMRTAVDKYPQLAAEVQELIAQLESVVHPFDGHMTRATQAGRFGPIRRHGGAAVHQPASPRMQLADVLSRREPMPGEPSGPRPWTALRRAPRAAREAVEQSVRQVQATRSEREYAEWWRRLVATHGMPLRLTMGGDRRSAGGDVAIDHSDSGAKSQPYELCGIVEAEDLPGLECHLDGRDTEMPWPASTCNPGGSEADVTLYRALFPLLPALSQALVRTVVNWAPVERELPARQFLATVGSPQPSEATCLGIVKYPRIADAPLPDDTGNPDSGCVTPRSPLGGSNVRRLGAARSQGANSSSSSSLFPPPSAPSPAVRDGRETVSAVIAARLLTQYAQWQALGGVLMRMLVGLQAGHVLHADFFAQLLMNENVIPAMFWWLGTAALDLCAAVPRAIRIHTFSAAFARIAEAPAVFRAEGSSEDPADPAAVGVDTSDSDDAADRIQSCVTSVGPATLPLPTTANSLESTAEPCVSALHGIYDCMRSLRRLTSSNGLRKGLLYKNKGLYFLGKLLRMPSTLVQQVAAEMCRDIMPVVSRRQRQNMLDIIGQVYLRAPVAFNDAFWLAEPIVDPNIEMHRHVELLRLLHFYHRCALGLQLPRDSALFPSLIALTSDPPLPRLPVCDLMLLSPQPGDDVTQNQHRKLPTSRRPTSTKLHTSRSKHNSATVSPSSSCGMQSAGAAVDNNSWLMWESDLEDTLNDVYSPSFGTSQS